MIATIKLAHYPLPTQLSLCTAGEIEAYQQLELCPR
jgi:hypothetical protein